MTIAAIVTAGSLCLLTEVQWDKSNTDDRRLTAEQKQFDRQQQRKIEG